MIAQLRERLRALFAERDDAELVLLFGSCARGEAGDSSDVDIAVLFSERPNIISLGGLVLAITEIAGKKTDLVELGGLEVENPRLAYEIASNPVVIFERSGTVTADFKTRAFLAYFDALPLLESANAALRGRIESGNFGRPIHA
jgi:predicted nucleotidyltransferase